MLRRAALGVALSCWAALPAAAANVDPSGTYYTQDGRARVRVEKCLSQRDRVCGYAVWMRNAIRDGQPATDAKNPSQGKAGRPLLGHQLMLGLTPNQEGQYSGKIYNAEDGKTYDVTIWREDGASDLKVKGCLLVFCQTQSWAKVNDLVSGQLAGATGAANGPQPDPEWGGGKPAAAGGGKRDAKPKS